MERQANSQRQGGSFVRTKVAFFRGRLSQILAHTHIHTLGHHGPPFDDPQSRLPPIFPFLFDNKWRLILS